VFAGQGARTRVDRLRVGVGDRARGVGVRARLRSRRVGRARCLDPLCLRVGLRLRSVLSFVVSRAASAIVRRVERVLLGAQLGGVPPRLPSVSISVWLASLTSWATLSRSRMISSTVSAPTIDRRCPAKIRPHSSSIRSCSARKRRAAFAIEAGRRRP
jgi:hypothetical protein